ncbi:hypothetical protein [Mesorhizobium sp. ESP-6-2]|uniref:hypothetical protein n=1 Tax=Mesorhizobium sp. ESP-6-2 TaxID=2876625 RepID=UPI001CCCE34D|nr:hypothetical protein [Mesorhizobium sp. ESP-6-2]MBZ9808101.1 hypothetical protein [Mesorhizobium sp. ESP-6-2]
MFVMTWEFADKLTVAVTGGERKFLMENLRPPDNWKIWIGRYNGITYNDQISHRAFSLGDISIKEPNSQTTTFQFGKLVVSCFSTGADFDFEASKYGLAVGLHTLWPLVDQAISQPALVADDARAKFLATAFTNDLLRLFG